MCASKREFSRHRSLLECLKSAGCGMASKSRLSVEEKILKKGHKWGHISLQGGLKNNEDGEICRHCAWLEVLKGNEKRNEGLRVMKMIDFIGALLGLACWKLFLPLQVQGLEIMNMVEFVGTALGLMWWKATREVMRFNMTAKGCRICRHRAVHLLKQRWLGYSGAAGSNAEGTTSRSQFATEKGLKRSFTHKGQNFQAPRLV